MRIHNALSNIYTQFTEYNLFEKLSQNISIFLIFYVSETIYDDIINFPEQY